jgi:cell division septation protein DedD
MDLNVQSSLVVRAALSCVVLLLLTVPVTAAPLPDLQVISMSVTSHFPDDLTFTIQVRSEAGDIVDAALFYQVGWEDAEGVGQPKPFAPAAEVTLTHVWDTSGATVPPFIEVTYYWRIVDSAGNTHTTAPVRTEYSDYTHDWQSLGNEDVIVYWYDQPDDFGVALFEAAAEGYDHVASITGITTERTARVVVYNNRRDFCAFYAPRSCQDWIGGQTFSGLTVQWGTDQDWFTYDVVPHELAHVFYNEVFSDTWVRVPTWFNEGIAVYNERHDHAEDMDLVLDAAAADELIPLRHMGTQASGQAYGDVRFWYSEAYSLVAFIADVYGEQKLGEVILTLADNHPMEDTLQQVLDMDLLEFEMGWREWLGYPVDSIPTPVTLAPVAIATIPLPPTVPRGQPAATATPKPPIPTTTPAPITPTAALPTPTPAPVGAPLPFLPCCCSSAGVVLLVVLVWMFVCSRFV